MMGLALSFYLAKAGKSVTLLEKENEIGGLSRSVEIMPDFRWDRFYHVILTTDFELLNFLDELGLSPDIKFRETKTGFYTDGRLHSMSSTLDFLRFKPIPLWDKIRLGLGILYASRINNWKGLEKTYAKAWLTRIFGRRNYERIWDPLLRSKLGNASPEASASFIWACIKRLYGTRQGGDKKELLGCVEGGYYSILSRVLEKVIGMGVRVLLNCGVEKLAAVSRNAVRIHCKDGNVLHFNQAIVTVPNPEVVRMWPEIPIELKSQIERVKYLSLICATLVLKRSLSPFYVTNLTDPGFPFTGLVETSHVMPAEVLGSKGLVYLPRYMPPDDPFFDKPSEEVLEIFMKGLKRIFPELTSDDVLASRLHREKYVQPIQEVGYSAHVPSMKSPADRIFLVNTSMIVNSTLNNNEVIKLARKGADVVLKQESLGTEIK